MPAVKRHGEPDWTRYVTIPSEAVFELPAGEHTGPYPSPVFYVGRFPYLVLSAEPRVPVLSVSVAWYADEGGTQVVGGEGLVVSNEVEGEAVLHVPNLGPYARLYVNPPTETSKWSASALCIGTAAAPVLPLRPALYVVGFEFETPIPGGKSTFKHTRYYSGPGRVYMESAVGGGPRLSFIQLTGQGGQGFTLGSLGLTGTETEAEKDIIFPPGAWYVEYTSSTETRQRVNVSITLPATGTV